MTRIGMVLALLLALLWTGATVRADDVAKFDGKAVAAEWYQAHLECRLPIQGQTNQQADEQCAHRDALTKTLQTHGLCFDKHEQEWGQCN